MVQAIKEHGLTRMATFTLATGDCTADESFERIQKAWNRCRLKLGRKGKKLEYVWVVETTERGYAHLHMFLNRFVPKTLLAQAWRESGGGRNGTRIEALRSIRAPYYVAKYVGKEVRMRRGLGMPAYGRHLYGTSRGIKFSSFMPKGAGWQVVAMSWRENAAWLVRNAAILEGGGPGSMRIVCRSWNGSEWLRAWGETPPLVKPVGTGGTGMAMPSVLEALANASKGQEKGFA
jgi:hypothetical protein